MPVLKRSNYLSSKLWSFGVEHEMSDWDATLPLPKGFGRDPKEVNICNSNGIAVDPSLRSYKFGGEFNTPPSNSVEAQGDYFDLIKNTYPTARVNWRCGLHVHIRVPGLKDDLPTLKRLSTYILENTEVYDLVDPLPKPTLKTHPDCYPEAKKRYNWMRMSHFTKIPGYRIEAQKKATTLNEFLEAEVPHSKAGAVMWHAQPRASINLRQLIQTDTIEFRHFPATMLTSSVLTAIEWCRDYLLAAFENTPAIDVFNSKYKKRDFPILDTIYNHKQAIRWELTTTSKNKRAIAEENIKRILQEDLWPPGCDK